MSFRDEHWEKMATAFLRSRLSADKEVLADENWPAASPLVLLDGGKGHKDSAFHDPFKFDKKIKVRENHLMVHISEACIETRRERQKIQCPLSICSHEVGHFYLDQAETLDSPFVRRKHFEGSSASSGIGPVSYTKDEAAWVRTFKQKKDIYGKTNRIAPGGRTPGVDSKLAEKMRRNDTDREHVFFFTFPWEFFDDVFRCVGARTATGLTIGDGQMAIGALMAGVPFVGVCLTENHRESLRQHLANTVFKGFFTEDSPFFDARIANELKEAGLAKAKEAANGGDSGEPPEKKPKQTATGKTPKRPAVDPPGEPPAPKKKPKKPTATDITEKMKAALVALGGDENGDGDDEDADEGGEE